jgi:predicted transglutaminase-like cysteine proteinase
MKQLFSAITITILACSLCGCAAHGTSAIAPMPTVSMAEPGLPISTRLQESTRAGPIPSGFVGFCLRNSDQCEAAKHGPLTIALNAENFAVISDINRTVNRQIQPEDDSIHYGPMEYWTIPTDGRGDCEDYALTKRKALLQAGFPIGALRLALVITAQKERHAVLTLATDRGDFILDNLSDAVRPWNEASYTWLERQNPSKPWRWNMLTADNAKLASGDATGEH